MSSEALIGITGRILGAVSELGSGRWRRREVDLCRSLAAAAAPRWLPDLPGRIETLLELHESARRASRETPEAYYWRATGDSLRELFVAGGFTEAHRFATLRLAKLTVPLEFMIPDINLIVDPLRPSALTDLFEEGLADAHVHSGAAVPFFDLLLQLLSGPLQRAPRKDMAGFDQNGHEFNIGGLAAGVRAGWWALHSLIEDKGVEETVTSAKLRKGMRRGTFWDDLRCGIADPHASENEFLNALWAEGTTELGAADGRLLSLAVERAASNDVSWNAHLAELLRSVSLLRAAATSVPGEGLARFVTRFNSLRVVRQVGGCDPSVLVHKAARSVSAGGSVRRFELRKTEYPERGRFYEELRDTLGVHLRGVGAALTADDMSCAFQMPLGFHRQGMRPWRSARAAGVARFDLSAHYQLIEAWTELTRRNPDAATHVGAFDVAGDEDAFPNWPFAIAFAELAERSPVLFDLQFSIHCGESFPTPLTGLRRVGESLLFPVPLTRLGHALALSAEAARSQVPSTLSGLEYCRASEVLDDVAWAVATFGADALDGSERAVVDRLVSVAYPGQRASLEDIADAYRHRFSRERLTDAGLLHRGAQEPSWTYPSSGIRPSGGGDIAVCILRNYLYGAAVGGVSLDLDVPVPVDLVADLAEVSDALYDRLLPRVVGNLVGRGVVIESCPTSNSILGHLPSTWHPWNVFAQQGLTVTVNTDDPGVFHNHICDEFESLFHSLQGDVDPLTPLRIQSLDHCSVGVVAASGDTYLSRASSLV